MPSYYKWTVIFGLLYFQLYILSYILKNINLLSENKLKKDLTRIIIMPKVFQVKRTKNKENKMKNNKLIAEFMGYPKIANDEDKRDYLEDCVKYHTSWDWLMPVVKKCFDTQHIEEGQHYFINWVVQEKTFDIDVVYAQIVEFIKDYNTGEIK